MKKYIVLISLVFVAFIGLAQTNVASVATDGSLTAGQYVSIWGTPNDTLTDGDTLVRVLRIKGDQTFDIKTQLYVNHVSGTASLKLKTYKSIDGVNYVVTADADSITGASVTGDGLDSEELTFSDVMFPYLKVVLIQTGTAVTVPKQYFITRKN